MANSPLNTDLPKFYIAVTAHNRLSWPEAIAECLQLGWLSLPGYKDIFYFVDKEHEHEIIQFSERYLTGNHWSNIHVMCCDERWNGWALTWAHKPHMRQTIMHNMYDYYIVEALRPVPPIRVFQERTHPGRQAKRGSPPKRLPQAPFPQAVQKKSFRQSVTVDVGSQTAPAEAPLPGSPQRVHKRGFRQPVTVDFGSKATTPRAAPGLPKVSPRPSPPTPAEPPRRTPRAEPQSSLQLCLNFSLCVVLVKT